MVNEIVFICYKHSRFKVLLCKQNVGLPFISGENILVVWDW